MNLNLKQNDITKLSTTEIALLKNVVIGRIVYNTTTSKLLIFDGSDFVEFIRGKNYKEYIAVVSQSSTNDPTVLFSESEFDEVVTWSRESAGTYAISIPGGFPLETIIIGNPGIDNGNLDNVSLRCSRALNGIIYVTTATTDGTLADGRLYGASFIIKVYS